MLLIHILSEPQTHLQITDTVVPNLLHLALVQIGVVRLKVLASGQGKDRRNEGETARRREGDRKQGRMKRGV